MTDLCDVPRCRALLDADSPELDEVFDPWYGINLDNRLEIFSSGVAELAIDIIKKDSPKHQNAKARAWAMFHSILPIRDVDNEQENIPIVKFTELGGIPLMARQLQYEREHNILDTSTFLTFAWCSTDEIATPHIVNAGIHKIALEYIGQGFDSDQFDTAMSLLRALSGCYSTRAQLRADRVLHAVVPVLDCLHVTNSDLDLRRGFRAASIIARLAGNDETGIGPTILRGNPVLIAKTVEMLDRVLDAGPKGSVINMYINPHFITMDILIIATSDVNKPLLKAALPTLIKALRLRGETNEPMTVDIVHTLLQLSYDKECLKFMAENKDEIVGLLSKIVIAPKYERDVMISSMNLQNTISNGLIASATPTSAVKSSGMKFGGLVKRVMKDSKATTQDAAERRKSLGLAPGQKHVMLSYNWGIKPIVLRVDEMLRAQGIKTWLDERDMGPNLNDSMAQAIEGAGAVFVFMTALYKESANCRKECEYADDYKLPITYIMAEENYKPNGWLGLQVGKAVWLGCWSLDHVESVMPQMLQRAKAAAVTVSAATTSVQSKAPIPVPKATAVAVPSSGGVAQSEMLTLLKNMQTQMAAMQSQMVSMQTSIEAIKSKLEI